MKTNIILRILFIIAGVIMPSCEKKSTEGAIHRETDKKADGELSQRSRNRQSTDRVSKSASGEKSGPLSQNEQLQKKLLEQPTPEWLVVGPNRTSILLRSEPFDPRQHRPKGDVTLLSSGGIKVDGKSMTIADEFKPTNASRGIRQGRIVLRKNTEARIYEAKDEKLYHCSDIQLPLFNFGEKRRWYINDWQFLNDDVLLGISNEEDSERDIVKDVRLYTYEIGSKTLRRVALPDGLVDSGDANLEILSVTDGVASVRTGKTTHYLQISK